SFLTAGVFQHFNGKQIGDRVWFIDDEKVAKFILASEEERSGQIYESMPSATVDEPRMLKISDWIGAVRKTENVFWSDTSQSFRQGNISPDWNAYEISGSSGETSFIVRSGLLKCYYLAAFLVVVVLSCGRLFSYPVLLIFVMIISQVLCYFLPLAYAAAMGGVFAGAGFSFIFAIIRTNLFEKNKIKTPNKQEIAANPEPTK
ncbi:MAG: hypothetical protein LBK06_07960, partial [Planctomycetaceae bacterium]|nr:hypothetical protein [Planctomycetaceae bacterium]